MDFNFTISKLSLDPEPFELIDHVGYIRFRDYTKSFLSLNRRFYRRQEFRAYRHINHTFSLFSSNSKYWINKGDLDIIPMVAGPIDELKELKLLKGKGHSAAAIIEPLVPVPVSIIEPIAPIVSVDYVAPVEYVAPEHIEPLVSLEPDDLAVSSAVSSVLSFNSSVYFINRIELPTLSVYEKRTFCNDFSEIPLTLHHKYHKILNEVNFTPVFIERDFNCQISENYDVLVDVFILKIFEVYYLTTLSLNEIGYRNFIWRFGEMLIVEEDADDIEDVDELEVVENDRFRRF